MPRKRLGEVLREGNYVSEEALQQVLTEQQNRAGKLGELLYQRGLITRAHLAVALETVLQLKYVNPVESPPSPEASKLVSAELCKERLVMPHSVAGRKLAIVMAEPQNLALLNELSFATGMEIVPRIGFPEEIKQAIESAFDKPEPEAEDISMESAPDLEFYSASSNERTNAAMREFQADLRRETTPAVRIVSAVLGTAFRKKSSDIHIEPVGSSAVVRLRIDGMLRELTVLPPDIAPFVVSRIKILADLDIAERRVPQDGRFLVQAGERRLDIRVSTLPTHDGEKVVMRVLDQAATQVSFTHLGMSAPIAVAIERILHAPSGMLLVTGPTGSGKSTTLYAALSLVRNSTLNIVTVEDPVEYKLEGINQVQVNPKAGLTFAGCLRSILRQDPNIIMLGEIRDRETAEIALQAAQTGHLVLSTLHTNDSVSAITRLLDLGAPQFLVASSVRGILAQRLLRKICECRQVMPSGLVEPVGCARCDKMGYHGRVGVYEFLQLDEPVRAAIRAGCRDDELRQKVRARGMRSMHDDALEKAEAGITTLEELYRVVPMEVSSQVLRCASCEREMDAVFPFCPYCGKPNIATKTADNLIAPVVRAVRSRHARV